MHGEGFRKLGFPVCALCCKTRRMSDSNVVIRKKRGRPRTGQDPVLSFRWGLDFKEAIDRWRAGEPHKPSRSEAIRWLIGQGLSFRPKTRCLMCPVSRALSHEAPPFVARGRSRAGVSHETAARETGHMRQRVLSQ